MAVVLIRLVTIVALLLRFSFYIASVLLYNRSFALHVNVATTAAVTAVTAARRNANAFCADDDD